MDRRLLLALAAAFALSACSGPKAVLVRDYYPGDRAVWNHIFSQGKALELPQGRVTGAIAPHHDCEVFRLGRFYRGLAERASPSVVVVVSPNHFERGKGEILVPPEGTSFETADGALPADDALAAALVSAGAARRDGLPWPQEHGIACHGPYVGRFFPGARFLPVLIRPGTEPGLVDGLSSALHRLLPPDALVLASVDFSHYQVKRVADLHDRVTRASIADFEMDRLSHAEVDSPESLRAVMGFCALRGARRASLLEGSSSWEFTRDDAGETTSHQYWVFQDGPPLLQKSLTLLIAGAGEPGLGLRDWWSWDRYRTDPRPGVRGMVRLAGKEARFLMGFDAYLFDTGAGTERRSIHGLRASFIGLRRGEEKPLPTASPLIRAERSGGADFVAVSVALDRGREGAAELARSLVGSGADLAVIKSEGGALAAYATGRGIMTADLGRFWEPGSPLSGSLLALEVDGPERSAELFPYSSQDGYPPSISQFWPDGEPSPL